MVKTIDRDMATVTKPINKIVQELASTHKVGITNLNVLTGSRHKLASQEQLSAILKALPRTTGHTIQVSDVDRSLTYDPSEINLAETIADLVKNQSELRQDLLLGTRAKSDKTILAGHSLDHTLERTPLPTPRPAHPVSQIEHLRRFKHDNPFGDGALYIGDTSPGEKNNYPFILDSAGKMPQIQDTIATITRTRNALRPGIETAALAHLGFSTGILGTKRLDIMDTLDASLSRPYTVQDFQRDTPEARAVQIDLDYSVKNEAFIEELAQQYSPEQAEQEEFTDIAQKMGLMWLPSGNSTDSDKVYLSKTLQGTRGNYSNGSSIDQNTTIALVSRRILDQKSLDTFIADATLRYQKLHQGKKDEIKTALTELTADITIDPTTGHLIYSPRDNTKQLTLGHNVYNNEEVISIRGFQTNSIFLDDMLRTAAELPRRQDDAIILLLNSNRVRDYNGTQGVVPISTADVRSYLARENYSLRSTGTDIIFERPIPGSTAAVEKQIQDLGNTLKIKATHNNRTAKLLEEQIIGKYDQDQRLTMADRQRIREKAGLTLDILATNENTLYLASHKAIPKEEARKRLIQAAETLATNGLGSVLDIYKEGSDLPWLTRKFKPKILEARQSMTTQRAKELLKTYFDLDFTADNQNAIARTEISLPSITGKAYQLLGIGKNYNIHSSHRDSRQFIAGSLAEAVQADQMYQDARGIIKSSIQDESQRTVLEQKFDDLVINDLGNPKGRNASDRYRSFKLAELPDQIKDDKRLSKLLEKQSPLDAKDLDYLATSLVTSSGAQVAKQQKVTQATVESQGFSRKEVAAIALATGLFGAGLYGSYLKSTTPDQVDSAYNTGHEQGVQDERERQADIPYKAMEHCKALHEFNPRSGPAKRLGDITTLGIAQLDQTDIFLGVKKFYIDTGKESGHLGQMYEMMHKHCSLPQPNLDKTTAAVNLYRELGVPNTRFITIDLADPAQSRQNLGL